MVARILWNLGTGLVQRALRKGSIPSGMGVKYPAIWRARPGFLDCDVNLHLNNSAFLYNMELARWHFSAVSGIIFSVLKSGRVFLIGSQTIRYRHSIPPFKPYEIQTQVAFWDDEWIYFLHHFQCPVSGKLYAEGLSRATLREGKKRVSVGQMFEEVEGVALEAPTEMPDVVKKFLEWDAACRVSMETQQDKLAAETSKQDESHGIVSEWLRSVNPPFGA